MSGICKGCGGQTTKTRARSKSGQCFSCEHGIERTVAARPTEEPTIEDRLADIERRLDRLEAEKFQE